MSRSSLGKCFDCLLKNGEVSYYFNKEEYDFLENDNNFNELNKFIEPLGKEILKTSDGMAYYLCYQPEEASAHYEEIKNLVTEIIQKIKPLVELLSIIKKCTNKPLLAAKEPNENKGYLNYSEISEYLNLNTCEQDRIKKIAFDLCGRTVSNKKTTIDYMDCIIRYLVDKNYLKKLNNKGNCFIATHKWSLIYDYLEYFYSVLSSQQEEIIEKGIQTSLGFIDNE